MLLVELEGFITGVTCSILALLAFLCYRLFNMWGDASKQLHKKPLSLYPVEEGEGGGRIEAGRVGMDGCKPSGVRGTCCSLLAARQPLAELSAPRIGPAYALPDARLSPRRNRAAELGLVRTKGR